MSQNVSIDFTNKDNKKDDKTNKTKSLSISELTNLLIDGMDDQYDFINLDKKEQDKVITKIADDEGINPDDMLNLMDAGLDMGEYTLMREGAHINDSRVQNIVTDYISNLTVQEDVDPDDVVEYIRENYTDGLPLTNGTYNSVEQYVKESNNKVSGGGANDKKKVRSYKKFDSKEEKSIGEVSYDSGFGKSPEGVMEMLGIYDINSSDDVIWDKYDKAISKIKDNYKDCKDWYDSVDKYMWEESGNKYYKGKLDTNDGIWNIKKADKAVRQAIKDDFDAKYARGIKIDEKKVKSLGAGYYRVKVDTQTYTAYSGDKRKGVTVDIQFTDTGDIEYSEVVQ